MSNDSEAQEMPESIFDVLASTRDRPGFFFASPSLDQLSAFLIGYETGVGRLGRVLRGSEEFDRFQRWLERKLGFPTPGPVGWSSMLRKVYPDDHTAFGRFFELMDEFCREQNIVVVPLQRQR